MKRTALSLVVAGAVVAGFAGQASGSSPNSGCPPPSSGWFVWYVGITGTNPPYHAPSLVDMKGNNDGVVCAKPLDSKTFQYNSQTYQVYSFIDNTTATP